MSFYLRQSTNSQIEIVGPFLDSLDGNTPENGLTINNTDIKLWKQGASAFVNKNSGGATTKGNSNYALTLDTVDTNTLGGLKLTIHMAGALVVEETFQVVTANFYNWVMGVGNEPLDVNTIQISGDAGAANNLESDYDGTGLNKSNSTIGTCTANSDMRGTDNALLAANVPANFSSLSISAGGLVDILQTAADKVWGSSARTLTSFGTLIADIWSSAMSEPSAGAPPKEPGMKILLSWIWMHFRNKGTLNKTTGEAKIYNDAGTEIAKGTDSDDGTTFTKNKLGAP